MNVKWPHGVPVFRENMTNHHYVQVQYKDKQPKRTTPLTSNDVTFRQSYHILATMLHDIDIKMGTLWGPECLLLWVDATMNIRAGDFIYFLSWEWMACIPGELSEVFLLKRSTVDLEVAVGFFLICYDIII